MTTLAAQPASADNIPDDSPIADALRKAEAAVAAIVAVPDGQRTFDNTVGAVDDLVTRLMNETEMMQFMQHVSTNAEERAQGQRATQDISNWFIDLSMREDLYNAIKSYAKTNPQLEGEQKRLLSHTMRDYRRAGMELSQEDRKKLSDMQKEMSDLSIRFQANIRDDDTTVMLTRDELVGMDDDFFATLPMSGDLYLCNMEYPTYLPIMEFGEVETTREKMWLARHRRAGMKNAKILEQILALRSQAAKLLGYANNVDFETEIRMAKNGASVKEFYDELRPVVRKKSKKEYDEFTAAKREHTGNADAQLEPWDVSFYESRLKNAKFAVDNKEVQQYFPMERAIDGLFSITQKLYGIEYKEVTADAASRGFTIWHDDVRVFDVIDKQTSELLGTFYLDLFPRANKYSHAAQFGLQSRKRWSDGKIQKPVVALVCNFTKPTKDKPSLLTHDEVETFFHEFGHCLHSILTTANYANFSGTACARDFVEAPSQMFENWVWDADVLGTFARHYKTNEPFPAELLKGMEAARNFGKGLWAERQLYYGLLDLTLHLDDDGVTDSTHVARDVFNDVLIFDAPAETWPQASFGHLMGYNSGYYGYMWSLVFAADMFQRFEELGMLSQEAGRYYRDKILAKGGTQDEMEMVEEYLGRAPKKEPFLKYLGLNN
ncbi:MAG: M3 family metallopeptidase [Phycisphaerae bacterium]